MNIKKLTLTVALVFSLFLTSQAQDFSQSLGIRGGWGAEISYQRSLKETTRFEGDLGLYGLGNNGFILTGVHQWLFGIQDGVNWYLGVGPQLGILNSTLGIGIAGQIGIEYNIPSVPLQISLDYRPSWFVVPSNYPFEPYGVGLGIRYRF